MTRLLKNLRVGSKLSVMIILFCAGFLGFGIHAYHTLDLVKVNGPYYKSISQGKDLISDIHPPPLHLGEAYLCVLDLLDETEKTRIDDIIARGKRFEEEYVQRHAFWVSALPDDKVKDAMVERPFAPAQQFLRIRDQEFLPAFLRGDLARAREVADGPLRQKYEEHRRAIHEVVSLVSERNKADEQAVAATISTRTTSLFVLGIVILILSCLIAWKISSSICVPLGRSARWIERMAAGDFSEKVEHDSRDEIGTLITEFGRLQQVIEAVASEIKRLIGSALDGNLSVRSDASKYHGVYSDLLMSVNRMMDAVVAPFSEVYSVLEGVAAKDLLPRMCGEYKGEYSNIKLAVNSALDNLQDALSQVRAASDEIATASLEISNGSQDMAAGATEQASSLEEVCTSLQEMTSMTRQNSQNAMETKEISESARRAAESGCDQMKSLAGSMEKIKESANQTVRIVKTIDEIAFQTNLLALNAAVEAARAGETGKGFAVVADEVRSLAMRSAEAAKSTASLIEASLKNVEDGVSVSMQASRIFEEIHAQVRRVSELMIEIASASKQQTEGVDQISSAVEMMSKVTQQNAASSEESAAASEELSTQANELRSLVAQFVLAESSMEPSAAQCGRRATPRKPAPRISRSSAKRRPAAQEVSPHKDSFLPVEDRLVLREF